MNLFDRAAVDEREPLVTIRLAGAPRGKGRPRSRIVTPRRGKQFVHVYTDAETQAYEGELRAAALDAMRGRRVIEEPVELLVFAFFEIPESWPAKRKDAALAGVVRPTVKPDFDNIAKVVDALSPFKHPQTGLKIPVVWRDDALVVDGRVIKAYAQRQAGLVIEVRSAGPAPKPWGQP